MNSLESGIVEFHMEFVLAGDLKHFIYGLQAIIQDDQTRYKN